jgi:hypothetical protein
MCDRTIFLVHFYTFGRTLRINLWYNFLRYTEVSDIISQNIDKMMLCAYSGLSNLENDEKTEIVV